jgi:hypothetical protein
LFGSLSLSLALELEVGSLSLFEQTFNSVGCRKRRFRLARRAKRKQDEAETDGYRGNVR